MAEILEFEAPSFLKTQTEAEIHKEMLEDILEQHPSLDISEGSVAWDMTRPTAKVKARMVGFTLTELIKNLFPMWSYSDNLDWHAALRGMSRKPAVKATGTVLITGNVGVTVPKGFLFKTESDYGEASVLFATTESVVIPETLSVNVGIEAYQAGSSGNVPAGTITILNASLNGIATISNHSDTTGGTNIESDDSLKERIVDYDQQQGISFVGSDADYSRWALEVTGVGGVQVIPASYGSEIVTLIISDADGQPASTELCTDVYNHIMSPTDRANRLAPVNDQLSVVSSTAVTITISATIEIEDARNIDDIKNDLYDQLTEYYKTAVSENVVRINEIGKILIGIDGVADYSGLMINSGSVNIDIGTDEIPITELTDMNLVE